MKFDAEIQGLRLGLQHITRRWLGTVPDLVAWMGAIQAQELSHALAAVGLRLPAITEAAVVEAIAQREIVHTWAMRGTLHLMAASDVWWMQQLVGAGIMSRAAGSFLKGGLDSATLAKSRDVLARRLPGLGPVLRKELVGGLAAAGIDMQGAMSSRIFSAAAYAGLICMGPVQGKQETFVWLEDWVPRPADLAREEAIARLCWRYFQSHGPATVADFVAWSGLGLREARAAMETHQHVLERWSHAGSDYYWIPNAAAVQHQPAEVHLLPGFDEYLIGYRDRAWVLPPQYAGQAILSNGIFRPLILVNGIARGIWKRIVLRQRIQVELSWFEAPTGAELMAVQAAIPAWERFWGMSVVIG